MGDLVESSKGGDRTIEFARTVVPLLLSHREENTAVAGLRLSPLGVSPGPCTLIPWPEIDRLAALLDGGTVDGVSDGIR